MRYLAVTTLDKIQHTPTSFWVNLLLAFAGAALVVLVVRHAAQMNRLLLTLIIFLFVSVVGFQWVFERNEPKFMTPHIQKIAPYFPERIDYQARQEAKAQS